MQDMWEGDVSKGSDLQHMHFEKTQGAYSKENPRNFGINMCVLWIRERGEVEGDCFSPRRPVSETISPWWGKPLE